MTLKQTYLARSIFNFSSCCFSVGVINSSSSAITCSVSSFVVLSADNIPSIFSFFSRSLLKSENKTSSAKIIKNFNFLKKLRWLNVRRFPVSFAKFFRTTFVHVTFRRLFLKNLTSIAGHLLIENPISVKTTTISFQISSTRTRQFQNLEG